MSVAVPNQINANLIRQYWDTKLADESLQRDIFSVLRTQFDRTSNIDIPMNALTLEINAEANNGYRTATVGFSRALNQAPRQGDLQLQIGFEEGLRELTQTIYYNEFSHAVRIYNYGIHYSSGTEPYGVNMDLATRKLGAYMEELAGLYYRQALLQRFSQNLPFSPVFQAQHWNPRFYVKNVVDTAQPAYSPVLQTYTNNIANACIAAGTGLNATIDARYLTALHHYCTTNRIEPLEVAGGRGYILTIPPSQKFHALSLDRTDSPASSMFTPTHRFSDKEKIFFPEGACLGKWINIYLVEDERAPTLTITGTAAPFTITAGYLHPGNNDQRDTSTGARDVGFLLGRAPLIDWYPVKVHHKYDDYNYQKWEGKGAFAERGINLRWYDAVTPTATSWEQRYCVACVWARDTVSN
jgi:hypothetical protein